jgi:hypothetical protein
VTRPARSRTFQTGSKTLDDTDTGLVGALIATLFVVAAVVD